MSTLVLSAVNPSVLHRPQRPTRSLRRNNLPQQKEHPSKFVEEVAAQYQEHDNMLESFTKKKKADDKETPLEKTIDQTLKNNDYQDKQIEMAQFLQTISSVMQATHPSSASVHLQSAFCPKHQAEFGKQFNDFSDLQTGSWQEINNKLFDHVMDKALPAWKKKKLPESKSPVDQIHQTAHALDNLKDPKDYSPTFSRIVLKTMHFQSTHPNQVSFEDALKRSATEVFAPKVVQDNRYLKDVAVQNLRKGLQALRQGTLNKTN